MPAAGNYRFPLLIVGVGLAILAGFLWSPRTGKELREELRRDRDEGVNFMSGEREKVRVGADRWFAKISEYFDGAKARLRTPVLPLLRVQVRPYHLHHLREVHLELLQGLEGRDRVVGPAAALVDRVAQLVVAVLAPRAVQRHLLLGALPLRVHGRFLLAGLSALPTEPYESAQIDGASPLQLFWYLTLPMLRPTLMVALMFDAGGRASLRSRSTRTIAHDEG